MPDAIFSDRRLAAVYDAFDSDRGDLFAYTAMVAEFGARSVLDVGCGTGTFACVLAGLGLDVTGVDPALASLEVAQGKQHANRVQWIHGDATSLPPLQCDLAVMTGNVAQVFTTDEDWNATLSGIRAALRPGGRLVFETRVPEREAWRDWTRETTFARRDVPGHGVVEAWCDVTETAPGLVTFVSQHRFLADGGRYESPSTLRFRGRADVAQSLTEAGYVVESVREAPDRAGLEHVFVAVALE